MFKLFFAIILIFSNVSFADTLGNGYSSDKFVISFYRSISQDEFDSSSIVAKPHLAAYSFKMTGLIKNDIVQKEGRYLTFLIKRVGIYNTHYSKITVLHDIFIGKTVKESFVLLQDNLNKRQS